MKVTCAWSQELYGGRWDYLALYDWDNTELRKASLKRNGKVVLETSDEWPNCQGGFIHLDVGFPLFMEQSQPGMGSSMRRTFYRVERAKLTPILRLEKQEGGPILRDIDKDGEFEWIVDDYDYYTYYGSTPKWLKVYKFGKDRRLHLWKTWKNQNGLRLPSVAFSDSSPIWQPPVRLKP
ncbi:MAG: hypothetical protein J0L72_02285 [Armatimonadetes bacterium]|nr:hypothetical protein [Armatimonadota bacterium]